MKRGWLFALFVLIPVAAAPAPQHYGIISNSAGTVSPEWVSLRQSLRKMHAAMMSEKPSGNGDLDFASLMLPHHKAAIEMARAQLLYGTDPQMRRLAQEIVTEQQSEIELMQLWLRNNDPQNR